MAKVYQSDYSGPVLPERCDWGFFSGSHCGDVSDWCSGENFSICRQHYAQLLAIHSLIPNFSRRFCRAS
jgi:hypothetical protein